MGKKSLATSRQSMEQENSLLVQRGAILLLAPVIFLSTFPVQAAELSERYQQTLESTEKSHKGIRAGSFVFLPALGIKTEFDDNIDNSKDNKTEDIVTAASGAVAFSSDWSRHNVTIGTSQTKVSYKERKDRNATTGSYFIRGRYDLTKETELNSSFTRSKRHLNRGTGSDLDVANPIDYWVDTLTVGFKRTLGMIQVALDGRHIVSTILDKAKAFGTDYEKKESNGIGGRVTYVSSPGNTVYLATNYTDNSYNLIDGSKRDTRLLDARVGGTYTPNGIYNAGLYTGWQRHTDHSTDEEQKLFSLGGNFQWNITRLTNLEYSYEKSFREGEAAANDTAEITAQQLTLGNRFTPNWNGNISLRREDFEYTSSGATNSTIYIGKIENSFSLTDSLDLNIGLSHQRKEADDRDSEYKSNNVYVSFTYIY